MDTRTDMEEAARNLVAENTRLRTDLAQLQAELQDAAYTVHRLEAARRQLDGEKERIIDAIEDQYATLLAAAKAITDRKVVNGMILPVTPAQLDTLRAAVAAVEPEA